MSDFDHDLERELRDAAPQAPALFVDEVARRVHAQRPGLRPNRLRLSLAFAFSALTIVALGVLGAPAYVAHAAGSLLQTATTTLGGGTPTTNALLGGGSSGSVQYETPVPICHRANTDQLNPRWALIVDSPSNHLGHADIIPAPPWGCPPNHGPGRPGDPSETTTTLKSTTDSTGALAGQKKFSIVVRSADGSIPRGSVFCFDNLSPFDQTVLVDGKATCTFGIRALGTHIITAVFHTGDVKKWTSSAGNVLVITGSAGPRRA